MVTPTSIFGINVTTSDFCRRQVVEFKVEPWPIKKKRRGWRVVRHERTEDCAYMVSGALVMHPRLLEKMAQDGRLVKALL